MKSIIHILIAIFGMHWTIAQSLIPNGNFEAFTNGIPTGWTYAGYSGNPTLNQTTVVSPFTDVYPTSHHSLKFVSDQGSAFYGSFTPQSGALIFSFDFFLGPGTIATNNYWFMELQGGFTHNLFTIGKNEQLHIIDDSGDIATSINRNTWYHLSLSLNDSHDSYSISLTPFGGTTREWSDRIPMNIVDISRIYLTNWTNSANAPFYLDNVAIVSVPEPRIVALFILGFIMLAAHKIKSLTRRCS